MSDAEHPTVVRSRLVATAAEEDIADGTCTSGVEVVAAYAVAAHSPQNGECEARPLKRLAGEMMERPEARDFVVKHRRTLNGELEDDAFGVHMVARTPDSAEDDVHVLTTLDRLPDWMRLFVRAFHKHMTRDGVNPHDRPTPTCFGVLMTTETLTDTLDEIFDWEGEQQALTRAFLELQGIEIEDEEEDEQDLSSYQEESNEKLKEDFADFFDRLGRFDWGREALENNVLVPRSLVSILDSESREE